MKGASLCICFFLSFFLSSSFLKNNQLKKVENGYQLTLCSGSVRLYKRCSKTDLGPLCGNSYCRLQDALTFRSKEKFIWDIQKGITQLACKTIEDAQAKILLATRYQYDSQGNVTEEKQINNPLESDLVLAKSMSFVQHDPFHNPLEIKDSLGNTETYCYKQGTHLVTKKLIQDKFLSIKKRIFYFYDEDAVLLREVTDDGTSADYNSLVGVTERHIIEIEPPTSSKQQKEVHEEKYIATEIKQAIRTIFSHVLFRSPTARKFLSINAEQDSPFVPPIGK